jgi:hypothetical protein
MSRVWKKLKFWRRNDVAANFQGHNVENQVQREERNATLEPMAATLQGHVTQLENIVEQNTEKMRVEASLRCHVTPLENIVEQQSTEKVQVEATLRGRITELEEELAKRERLCKCKELRMRLKGAHCEKIVQECKCRNLEAYRSRVINNLYAKLRESNMNKKEEDVALHVQMNELNGKLKDTISYKEDMESAISGKMKKLVALAVSVAVVGWVLL